MKYYHPGYIVCQINVVYMSNECCVYNELYKCKLNLFCVTNNTKLPKYSIKTILNYFINIWIGCMFSALLISKILISN